MAGRALTVAAPGVLENDTVVGGSAAAELRDDVDHGSLDLHEDGGFRYAPDSGFVGTDRFTYRIPAGVLLLLPSEPATVTITVTAAPTPTPDPTPKPTPAPTPVPTPVPTPRPTIAPIVTVTPLPSIDLLPTLPTVTPTPRPSATAAPSRSPAPTPTSKRTTDPSGGPAGPIASPPGSGPGSPDSSRGSAVRSLAPADATPSFTVPTATGIGDLDLDTSLTLRGFEWAIPALVLTVPGILLLLALVAQAVVGILWVPVTRRWLGGDRRRRVRAAMANAA
jgi:hypothetical protein